MNLDELIYGRNDLSEAITGWYFMRPTYVDMDTVREVAHVTAAELSFLSGDAAEPSILYKTVQSRPGATVRDVPEDELDGLSDDERSRLLVEVASEYLSVGIYFVARGMGAGIRLTIGGAQTTEHPAVLEAIRDKVTARNRPVFRRRRAVPLVLGVGAIAIVGLWVWAAVTVTIPLPIAILGWMAVLGFAGYIINRARKIDLRVNLDNPLVGHRIASEKRAETRARRADTKANLKLSLITLPIGAALGVLGTLLVDAIGSGS